MIYAQNSLNRCPCEMQDFPFSVSLKALAAAFLIFTFHSRRFSRHIFSHLYPPSCFFTVCLWVHAPRLAVSCLWHVYIYFTIQLPKNTERGTSSQYLLWGPWRAVYNSLYAEGPNFKHKKPCNSTFLLLVQYLFQCARLIVMYNHMILNITQLH